jgi:hypothetical protein
VGFLSNAWAFSDYGIPTLPYFLSDLGKDRDYFSNVSSTLVMSTVGEKRIKHFAHTGPACSWIPLTAAWLISSLRP